jgi:hypothetical protein
VRIIKDIDNGKGELNIEELGNVMLRLSIPEDKMSAHWSIISSLESKVLNHSEAIEFIEKMRKSKIKKK